MKIILSRKGFDSASGGCPSPVLPDGTLLSMPIPSQQEGAVQYRDLVYGGRTYEEMLSGLNPGVKYEKCHLDPDIRQGIRRILVKEWNPAFGQTGSAAGVLRNAKVAAGDLFLFFGWFRETKWDKNGMLRFRKDRKPLQIIYGYLQVGEILDEPERIRRYSWHPHAAVENYGRRNDLYLPCEKLSLLPGKPGCGVLRYADRRVLTMPGKSPACWKPYPFLMPEHVCGNRKNSARGEGLYYKGRWQELVLKPSPEAESWAGEMIGQAPDRK